jgi:prepilin-type processing-associated H-X9-DG protein
MQQRKSGRVFAGVALTLLVCAPVINAEPGSPPVEQTAAQSDTDSTATLQQLGQGILRYLRARGRFPQLQNPLSWEARRQFYPYVRDERWFLHPATEEPYFFNQILSHKNPAHIPNPQSFAVFYESQLGTDERRGVLFLDGHVERVKAAHWEKIKKASKIG